MKITCLICPPSVLDIVNLIVSAERSQRAKNRVERSGAVSCRCKINNGAGFYRNRFEREAALLDTHAPLTCLEIVIAVNLKFFLLNNTTLNEFMLLRKRYG